MEPTPPTNEDIATPPTPEVTHRAHTYEDDLSKAMNATDANVVQEMLSTAREREAAEAAYHKSTSQRKWYSFFSILLVILAASATGYSIYHYNSLTVPAEKTISVGVFPNTDPIVTGATDIRQTIATLQSNSATLSTNKPYLVPLVQDEGTLSPITKQGFFEFIEAAPTEPLVASMTIVRLGVLHDGFDTTPFVIMSVPDPQIASKELLIAEPKLIQLFYRALAIDVSNLVVEIGKTFESTYIHNLPVRILSHTDTETGGETPLILYGYATNNIIVITTKPSVLKAVYDTIIKQQ